MKKKYLVDFFKRAGAIMIIMSLLLLMFENIPGEAKPKISAKKVTIEVGEKYTVKLTGLSSKKTADWTISKTKVLKKVKVTKNSIKVKGKKAGTSYVTATVGKKTYKCKIKVVKKQQESSGDIVKSYDDYDQFAGAVAGLVKDNPVKVSSGKASEDRFATARLIVRSKSENLSFDAFAPTAVIRSSDNLFVVQFASSSKAQDAFAEICALDDVEWAEPDAIVGTNLDLNIPERLDGGYDYDYSEDETGLTDPELPELGSPVDETPGSNDPGNNTPGNSNPDNGNGSVGGSYYYGDEHLSWGVSKLGCDAFAKTVSGSLTVAVVDTGVELSCPVKDLCGPSGFFQSIFRSFFGSSER